jgi:glucokinase
MRAIGIDVGGTKVLGVVVEAVDPSTVLAERRVPTPDGGAGLVDAIVEVVDGLEADVGAPAALGVGVPGLVDRHGVLHVGPHLRHLTNVALATLLVERTHLPTVVDNDANCHAVAEHRGGAAVGADEALVVTLGTGIGAGIITGGALLHGANGFAGEPGHMIVDPNGPPCPCGKRGCWERYASGTGLGRLARDAAHGGRLDAVVELAGGDPDAVRGEHVTAAARGGDPEAQAVLDDLGYWIALGLANLVNILDPAVIVIGGGLVDAAELFLPNVRLRFGELVIAGDQRPRLPIVGAALGGRAGAIGAAVLAAGEI